MTTEELAERVIALVDLAMAGIGGVCGGVRK
jgi:hypothetical protein